MGGTGRNLADGRLDELGLVAVSVLQYGCRRASLPERKPKKRKLQQQSGHRQRCREFIVFSEEGSVELSACVAKRGVGCGDSFSPALHSLTCCLIVVNPTPLQVTAPAGARGVAGAGR